MFEKPVLTVRAAEEFLGCSFVTASKLVDEMERHGLLRETTGQKRNRMFRYEPYLALFEQHGMTAQPTGTSAPVSQSDS